MSTDSPCRVGCHVLCCTNECRCPCHLEHLARLQEARAQ